MKRFLYYLLFIMPSVITADESIKFTSEQIRNIGIEVGNIALSEQSLTNPLPAKITIPNKSQRVISAPQDGLVEIMLVAEGDNIVTGQALAQINSPQLLANQNNYLQALSRSTQSKQEMLRDKSLFEEGIIAERRYLQTQSNYQQDNTEVAMYKKSLELAGMDGSAIAQLNKTRLLSSHLTITATSGGVVMKLFATAGQRLTAAAPLYQIAQLSPLWLEIHVPLYIAKQVKVDDPIVICEKEIEGQVITIGREVHAADQGVLVRAEINKNTNQLTPGEFVQACLVQQGEALQFKLPRSAVFRHEGNTAVFLKANGGFVSHLIDVVHDNGEYVIVTGEFSAQQQVVIKGTAAVKAAWLGMGGE
jgi:membrane fusion protein, heavy metal efflux system